MLPLRGRSLGSEDERGVLGGGGRVVSRVVACDGGRWSGGEGGLDGGWLLG